MASKYDDVLDFPSAEQQVSFDTREAWMPTAEGDVEKVRVIQLLDRVYLFRGEGNAFVTHTSPTQAERLLYKTEKEAEAALKKGWYALHGDVMEVFLGYEDPLYGRVLRDGSFVPRKASGPYETKAEALRVCLEDNRALLESYKTEVRKLEEVIEHQFLGLEVELEKGSS